MKRVLLAMLVIILSTPAIAQTSESSPSHSSDHAIFLKSQDIKWERIMPELGDVSPEISILHVDPKTQATELMIRVPKNFHVRPHWHSANETHTVISGTFIMGHEDGTREELGAGSFNYMPSKMVHEAWTKPDEGTVLFITVDAAWDVNWVDGPPTAQK